MDNFQISIEDSSAPQKFKDLSKKNKIPSAKEVAKNILNKMKYLKVKSGNYIDLRD